jgi:hypothetical protein
MPVVEATEEPPSDEAEHEATPPEVTSTEEVESKPEQLPRPLGPSETP